MNRERQSLRRQVKALMHDRYAIPADTPALLRFYLDHLLVPHSRREMVWAALARRSVAAARASLPLVGGKRGEIDLGLDHRALGAALRQAGLIEGRQLECIALRDYGNSERGKTILFLFEESARAPVAIGKSSTVPEHRARLAREQKTLRTLGDTLPPGLRPTVPTAIGEVRAGDAIIFCETVVGGRLLYRDLRNSWAPQRLSERHFRPAGEWLLEFQKATTTKEVTLDDEVVGTHLLGPFEALAALSAASPAVLRLAEELRPRARALKGERFPLVARHGDFWARNVMLHGNQVRVIDWEDFAPASNPFHDWFHFAASYGLGFPWRLGQWEEPVPAFRSTFVEANHLTAAVQRHFARAAAGLNVSPALLELFFPVYLAEQAVAEVRRTVAGNASARWCRLLEAYPNYRQFLRLTESPTSG